MTVINVDPDVSVTLPLVLGFFAIDLDVLSVPKASAIFHFYQSALPSKLQTQHLSVPLGVKGFFRKSKDIFWSGQNKEKTALSFSILVSNHKNNWYIECRHHSTIKILFFVIMYCIYVLLKNYRFFKKKSGDLRSSGESGDCFLPR